MAATDALWCIGWQWYALGLLPIVLYSVRVAVANGFSSAAITTKTVTTALSMAAFGLPAIGLSMLFTWLFNGSGGTLIPVLFFHATQD